MQSAVDTQRVFGYMGLMFTLADLTRISGTHRRTVQLWAEAGALMAEPMTERQGSGVHRVFSRDEAIICLILSRVSMWNPAIGRLLQISSGIRFKLRNDAGMRGNIEAAIQGFGRTILLALHGNGAVELISETDLNSLKLLAKFNEENDSAIIIFLGKALSALRYA